ncbi:MAG: spermidine synthase, partial [Myxococcota bacterium]
AVALFGIGLGGAAYSVLGSKRQATLLGFTVTCLLEAAALALAFALGDRVALLALQLRPLGAFGFGGLVISWAVVTSLVVLPAAFIAGIQIPLLINLMGRGERGVGRHVGLVYAFNTTGAVAGSLASGFGLLSLLGAIPSWRLVVALLLLLGTSCAIWSAWTERVRKGLLVPAGILATTVLMLTAHGPTAAWRHSAIGAGRMAVLDEDRNEVEQVLRKRRRCLLWEEDGVESSVGAWASDSLALLVNGKSDGSAVGDAPTTVMLGLVGAVLHPNPRLAAVIGLGTGATSGWLAEVRSIERVDTIELEPAVVRFAENVPHVNHDVVNHPKSRILIGDAREKLLVSREQYDLVVSEPSNPFRAGIASLLTTEFYGAVDRRLTDDGLFVQWLQAYEVDARTVRIIYATLASVFPHVETWQTMTGDLLFVCSRGPLVHDVERLRSVTETEPFRSALALFWGVEGAEGLLSRYVASSSFSEKVANEELELNTDDRLPIEFAFARTVGMSSGFSIEQLRERALSGGKEQSRPRLTGGDLDWDLVEEHRLSLFSTRHLSPPATMHERLSPNARALGSAHAAFVRGRLADSWSAWQRVGRDPIGLQELRIVAAGAVEGRADDAEERVDALAAVHELDARFLRARLALLQEDFDGAFRELLVAFEEFRSNPWVDKRLLRRGFADARLLADRDKSHAQHLLEAIKSPFSTYIQNEARLQLLYDIGTSLLNAEPSLCLEFLAAFEPHAPWEFQHLFARASCYSQYEHPLADAAIEDLDRYLSWTGEPFDSAALELTAVGLQDAGGQGASEGAGAPSPEIGGAFQGEPSGDRR